MPIQGSTSASFVLGSRITPQSDTIVLLPLEGAYGDTTTQDLALPRKYVTFYGDARLDTNSKFGNTSLRLAGSQDRVEVQLTDRVYTTFTLEAWVNYSNFTTYAPIMSLGVDENNVLEYATDGQRIRTRIVQGGVEVFNITTAITAILRNVWHHYVLVCDGTNMRFMIDGSTYAYYPGATFPFVASKLTIGNFLDGINNIGGVDGYIDDVRFSKSVRYSDPYDIPLYSISYTDAPLPTIRNITGNINQFQTTTILINGTNFAPDMTVVRLIDQLTNTTLITSSTVTYINPQQITISTDTTSNNLVAGTVIDIEVESPITHRLARLVSATRVSNSPIWVTGAGLLGTFILPVRNINIPLSASVNGGDPITYSLVSGSLPAGVALNPTTGSIFGQAPEVAAGIQFTFIVRATANNDPSRTSDRTFSIIQQPTLPVWSTTAGSLGTFSDTVRSASIQLLASSVDGNSVTFNVQSGTLPGGLTLSNTGLISGTTNFVTTDTTSTFTIRATTSNDPFRIADRTFSIQVTAATISISTLASLGTFTDVSAQALSVSASASSGAITYSVVNGSLPAGCSLNTSTGSLGTIGNVTGDTVSTFTIRATTASGGIYAERIFTTTVTLYLDGSTSIRANTSAVAIKSLTGTNTDGVYYINLPSVGSTAIYCIMNSNADGGGWMMAMKATRGTTFNYNANYWTVPNTLFPERTNRDDGDAKFSTMNNFAGKDLLAVWPDIGTAGGGLGSGAGNPFGTWTWLQNNWNGGARTSMVNFFSTAGSFNNGGINDANSYGGYFVGLAKSNNAWANGIFSSQADINFYGFNFKNNKGYGLSANVRWGFGWNENTEGNYTSPGTLATGGAPGSDDVSGGIGMDSNFGSYSSGDKINCCQDSSGIDRSARVEIYVR